MLLSSTIGLGLAGGPGGLLGFGKATGIPSPKPSMDTCCSNEELRISAMTSIESLNSSLQMLSGTAARPFCRRDMENLTSFSVLGFCRDLASHVNG